MRSGRNCPSILPERAVRGPRPIATGRTRRSNGATASSTPRTPAGAHRVSGCPEISNLTRRLARGDDEGLA